MAGHGWATGRPVAEALFEAGYRFDFFQAVRLLALLRPEAPRPGEGASPDEEPVRLRASVDMGFPSSDVASVTPPSHEGAPPELTVHFLGLAGPHGPLPLPFAQWVRDRLRQGDTGPRDFLDLFQHRLLALRYRAHQARRVGQEVGSPETHGVAGWLYALMGLGLEGMRDRRPSSLPDRALLRYAGLLARRPRSLAVLEAVVSDFFGVPARSRSFEGAWLPLDEEQQTRLGVTGHNQRLGEAVLGSRVWDQQARFVLVLGPLGRAELEDFLPGGHGLASLGELVRFVAGTSLDFDLELVVAPSEVRGTRLGDGARLGWSSWMKPRPGPAPREGHITLTARHTRPAPGGLRLGWNAWLRASAARRPGDERATRLTGADGRVAP
ncbi:type VI secretion system baseplate subunit TssG [Archangium sp.]|jgi:type VI secretion system protein ImpH|uniref:type VI secretion system baseplate subunit TssG n=1 Tax=Archangium sp. TaxID=1872627 RepID=UPI002ED8D709